MGSVGGHFDVVSALYPTLKWSFDFIAFNAPRANPLVDHRSPVADAFARKKEVESVASVPGIWIIFLGAVDQTKSVSVVTPQRTCCRCAAGAVHAAPGPTRPRANTGRWKGGSCTAWTRSVSAGMFGRAVRSAERARKRSARGRQLLSGPETT